MYIYRLIFHDLDVCVCVCARVMMHFTRPMREEERCVCVHWVSVCGVWLVYIFIAMCGRDLRVCVCVCERALNVGRCVHDGRGVTK